MTENDATAGNTDLADLDGYPTTLENLVENVATQKKEFNHPIAIGRARRYAITTLAAFAVRRMLSRLLLLVSGLPGGRAPTASTPTSVIYCRQSRR